MKALGGGGGSIKAQEHFFKAARSFCCVSRGGTWSRDCLARNNGRKRHQESTQDRRSLVQLAGATMSICPRPSGREAAPQAHNEAPASAREHEGGFALFDPSYLYLSFAAVKTV